MALGVGAFAASAEAVTMKAVYAGTVGNEKIDLGVQT